MTHAIASIRHFMTSAPVSVEREQSLAYARSLMKQHGVRHLPVVDAQGSVVGVLSDRSIQLIARRWDIDDSLLTADMLTTHDVFSVTAETPLDVVCATMAEHRYGCAVVVEDRRPIGMFTTTDACAALATLARTQAA